MKVSVAPSTSPSAELDRAVVAAYASLHDACLAQARKASADDDVYTVYLWMKRAIAAQGMADRVARGII